MTWNKPKSETQLLRTIVDTLSRELPAGWAVKLLAPGRAAKSASDAMLELKAGREHVRLAVEVKLAFEPRHLRELSKTPAQSATPRMLAAPYLSRTAQMMLVERNLSFADATGNVRLALERPALYVRLYGADREPWRAERPLRSLRGRIAGRVVRALCDFRAPYGVRDLAERSGASTPSVSRAVAMLDSEALLERRKRGPVMTVEWEKLLRRWAEEYVFSRSNRVRRFIALRGLPAMMDLLKRTADMYAITGSFATLSARSIAPPRLAMIYTHQVDRLAEQLGLDEVETGVNVLLAEPFDPVVFDRTKERDGLRYAALSQVAVDLLSGPGRSPQEGEALIEWMRDHESEWRA